MASDRKAAIKRDAVIAAARVAVASYPFPVIRLHNESDPKSDIDWYMLALRDALEVLDA